jgi:hypothetical protein
MAALLMWDWVFENLGWTFELLLWTFGEVVWPFLSPVSEEGAMRLPQTFVCLAIIIGGILLIWFL